ALPIWPSVLDLVRSGTEIAVLSQLGIAVLLFLVGIKLDVKLIRSLGTVSLMTGLGQVLFTSVFGYLIGLALGLQPIESLYVAVALTFSSTIIVVKLLSDKREIDSLHGQVALGFLIVQDLVVVLAMIVLSAVGIGAATDSAGTDIIRVLGLGVLMLLLVGVFVRYVADPLVDRLARVPELLICFAIALAALFAAIGDDVGFGKELGGLLAGVALASTRYREMVAARLAPLRDFLLLFFFIGLGATLEFENLGPQAFAAAVFSAFVLIGNPLIVLAIMGALGFRKRTGFLCGLTVAQISEFSLIFVAMGVTLGHVGSDALGLTTLVGLITITASTYMITYSHRLYALCEPFLAPFERREAYREEGDRGIGHDAHPDVLLFGLGRFGTAIGLRLQRRRIRILGIDFNPDEVRRWRDLRFDVEFGDATDAEFISTLPMRKARWAISTVPIHDTGVTHYDPRLAFIRALRDNGFEGRIAVASPRGIDAEQLMEAGADLVLDPFQDAADRAVDLLFAG